MLLATALALLITGCTQQTFTVQNKPAAVAPKETITPSFLRARFIGFIDAAKFVAAQKSIVKTETSKHFVNGLLGFVHTKHSSSAGSACVLLTIIA